MIPVLIYIIGLIVFGFVFWLLDGIMDIFKGTGLADTTTFTVYPALVMIWAGCVIVYVIGGGIWLTRSYNEYNNYGGM